MMSFSFLHKYEFVVLGLILILTLSKPKQQGSLKQALWIAIAISFSIRALFHVFSALDLSRELASSYASHQSSWSFLGRAGDADWRSSRRFVWGSWMFTLLSAVPSLFAFWAALKCDPEGTS